MNGGGPSGPGAGGVLWNPSGDGFLSPDQIIKTVSRIEPNIVIPYGVEDAASPEAAWRLVARELHGADPVADGNLNANRRQLPDPVDVRLLERRN